MPIDGTGTVTVDAVMVPQIVCDSESCPSGRPDTRGPSSDIAGKTVPHKPILDNLTGGKPPGVSNIVEMIKNGFSEFEGDKGAKIACGNISNPALSACLAESQYK